MALLVTRKVADDAATRAVTRRAAAGELRQILAGLYTDDLTSPLEDIVRREIYGIVAVVAPGATISHRSALERPGREGHCYLTSRYRRTIDIGGMKLHLVPGPMPLPTDIRIPTTVGPAFVSSTARAYLENFQDARARAGAPGRTFKRGELEDRIERLLSESGPAALTALLEEAQKIAPELGMGEELERFELTTKAILGINDMPLTGAAAIARRSGLPYDARRVDLFGEVLEAVRNLRAGASRTLNPEERRLAAFVESYFSNFIEGTEFEIGEARDIVLGNRPLTYREDDAHDILGTHRAALKSMNAARFPDSFASFEARLKEWNREVIFARAALTPGEFKDKNNRAGMTTFVPPELVRGTLQKGMELIAAAPAGLPRAAMAHFVVTEIHPFNDGNGRTARMAMNEALSTAGSARLIIPTVFRDDYVLALKAISASGDAVPYARMLDRAMSFSMAIPYTGEAECFKFLRDTQAFKEPSEALLRQVARSDAWSGPH